MAFVNTGYGKAELLGIRIDGKGDVTDTHEGLILIKFKSSHPY
jgi:hypothetical protein